MGSFRSFALLVLQAHTLLLPAFITPHSLSNFIPLLGKQIRVDWGFSEVLAHEWLHLC